MIPLVEVIRASCSASDQHEWIRFADEIVARVGPLVGRYVHARYREADADDVVQDVLIVIATRYAEFEGNTDAEFFGWCYRIAHNKVVDRIRRKVLRPTVSLDVEEIRRAVEADMKHSPPDDDECESVVEILNLLRNVKPPCVDYLKARFVEGLAFPQIAAIYDSTPDAMRMNVNRCLALARRLAKRET